ncbi:lanthionine synthetase LanC family protein [Streptomyces sp. SL13]|uniref:Lanthionine synthetase LanC family protein n=1 Tax=Streptantibioticus silvisoli TaxID=2705255 RepID=A0AA90H4U1_9ACTN|nr:lanthionine synthetase LanC family protein [Streptantibioticus silvisoli]MDI5968825.1 lanthionine synthetase LanC family protein [Streptantibioticus silvisoli]
MITPRPSDVEGVAAGALEWLLATARPTGNGLAWATRPSEEHLNPVLYSGTAGVVLALLEAERHFGDERYGDAAVRGARSIAAAVEDWELSSLYFGLTGMAVALRAVHERLGEAAAGAAASRALDLVRSRFDGTRWGPQFDLLGGNAGVALGALAAGDVELAVLAVTPYTTTAETTPVGVVWETRAGRPARLHHTAHGTLGVVHALASVGRTANRTDLTELAAAGAADVVARDEAGPEGFLVPHSDPQDQPERNERHSYGWCNGPTGDAQTFRLLREVLGDPAWSALTDRCWHTVTHSGLPRRPRPGFWDNNGQCCGTAGVLALACDREVEYGDGLDFAQVLVADLLARTTADANGACWSNVEYRAAPSSLEPTPGWAMGNAGIVRELLRFARVSTGRDPGYAVTWPDRPAAVAS